MTKPIKRTWSADLQGRRDRHSIGRGLFGSALAAALVTVCTPASAQIAGAPGSISQVPPAPETSKALPDIRIERRGSVPDNGPIGEGVLATALHITGATKFSEATLVSVAGFHPGATLTISDLRRMAGLISNYYNEHGYVVAQAYVPEQVVSNGVVTLAIVEGRYGAVSLNNRSRLRSEVARGILGGLKVGDVVEAAPLERRLLLLTDIPGLRVNSELSPGATVGSSNLTVKLDDAPLLSGNLQVDDDGNPYTGRYRGGGTLNLNDPLGLGDQLSLRLLTSGDGLQYGRVSYQAQVAKATVGVAYEDFHYDVGRQYGVTDQKGSEQIASLYASYPLIRSDTDTMRATASMEYRWLHNQGTTPALEGDRRAVAGSIGIVGDHRDQWGGGGSDGYSFSLSVGSLDIRTGLARAADSATAQADGDYVVFRGSLNRLQNVGGPFQLYAWVRGQVASKNLDIDEKFELGGAYAVRAYPEGEVYADEGLLGTLEGRVGFPSRGNGCREGCS